MIITRKGVKKVAKSKGKGKPAVEGGAVSQTHFPPSSALGWEGTGDKYFTDVAEDEEDKSQDFDVIEGQEEANSSPSSPTPPP